MPAAGVMTVSRLLLTPAPVRKGPLVVEKILVLRDKDGIIEACLVENQDSHSLCVQLTSETGEVPQWPVLEEQEIYLTTQEMDKLVSWWQEIQRQGKFPAQ
jgi:hypothetical protein